MPGTYISPAESTLYYLQSRYYDPELGRFINADVLVSTGQGVLGNNMFAYCLNTPITSEDLTGTYSVNSAAGPQCGCGRVNCPHKITPYTVSMGFVFSAGIGPLAMSIQLAVAGDSSGASELQMSYSAPNIFSTGLPSVDEMLDDILSDNPRFRFGTAVAGTFSFTNAPSVKNLYGPAYSVGGAVPGVALDYNAMPVGDGSKGIYNGVTVSYGMISPGFNVTMSNTSWGTPIPINMFDVIEVMNKAIRGELT